MNFPRHRVYGGAHGGGGDVTPEQGRVTATRNVFVHESGKTWSYRGITAFLLYYHWLNGQNVDPFVQWASSLGVNTVRVLGMVHWPAKTYVATLDGDGDGTSFGPHSPGWWEELLPFVDHLGEKGMRVEFVVFASAQDIMPNAHDQRAHLRKVVDALSGRWNCFIEICNEPWQNGVNPPAIFSPSDARGLPMAYGVYDFEVAQRSDGLWVATLPVLDYVTAHSPRDMEAWSRKAKDLAEYRDGSGDGLASNSPLYPGAHIPIVGDEPMGAAEADKLAGRQRSNIANDHAWYHANAAINGAGSTYHCDAGLFAVLPPAGGDQEACGLATADAWAAIEPEFQEGSYTRGGLGDLPLVWEPQYFPEQTSRIYGRILGGRACCVAIKPNGGWTAKAAGGWRIVSTAGPMNSIVHLER